MKKYDYAIIYEVKNREFETACLIKYELERRGYSVCVMETWQRSKFYHMPVKADVVITFALYTNEQIEFALRFVQDVKAIINMQWEQIYTNADVEKASIYQICGRALDAYHISWGQYNTKRLVEDCGVPQENIILAGHPAMDLTKPKFNGYYLDRTELLKQYNIRENSKIILFVSSFSYVGLPKTITESDLYQSLGASVDSFQELSVISHQAVLKWMEAAAKKHPDYTFIYRPHPAEANNAILKQMEQELPNFCIISERSIKQWICISDKIYMWYSTAAADAYYSRKSFSILRPISIPREMEVTIYNEAEFIVTYDGFEQSLISEEEKNSISKEVFDSYYYYNKDIYTYETICNHCEAILDKVKFQTTPAFPEFESKIPGLHKRLMSMLKHVCWILLLKLNEQKFGKIMINSLGSNFIKKLEYQDYALQSVKKHNFTEKEMQDTIDKLHATIIKNTEV